MAKLSKSKNLKPWKRGQSGNPEGRPLGARNRSTIVREWLEAKATDGKEGQIVDQLVRALIQTALKGNVQAFRELMDSAYGKTIEPSEVHTYVEMGKITATLSDGTKKALTFNVGKPRAK